MKPFMQSSRCQNIFTALKSSWPGFEQRLLSIAQHPDFSVFLSRYRGILEPAVQSGKRSQAVHELSHAVLDLVSNALRTVGVSSLEDGGTELQDALAALEGALNLAIYFWHGPGDRNFQFRTLVHYCECPEDPLLVSHPGRPDFFLRITEWGVQISRTDLFLPFPFRFSLARACDLNLLKWEDSQEPSSIGQNIAVLRVVQREFCQLIDEWEHCNSILAVRQLGMRKLTPEEQPR
ncbi:MAG: hypothetical protein ACO3A4_13500, partial [Silvanigrellaceae bacterium]